MVRTGREGLPEGNYAPLAVPVVESAGTSLSPEGVTPMERKQASDFPPGVLKLFDGYIHGAITRRDFLDHAGKYAVGGATAAAMLESLTPNYALGQQVAKDDARIKTEYLTYASPQGTGTVRGYFTRPAQAGGKEGEIEQ